MIQLQSELKDLLQLAYSAERAASFAYQGHAGAIWEHRAEVLKIMQEYEIPVSGWYEIKYYVIGKIICYSCYVIGWFMPMYFAGRLESGNVNEYFIMKEYFNKIGITKHDAALIEMGMKEKEHEVYFLSKIKTHKWLPFFEKVFSWGNNKSLNSIK